MRCHIFNKKRDKTGESIYNILGGCQQAVTEYIHEVESMLELKNISFGVDDEGGQKEIIRDISLTIKENQFVVITGPNGGGKSTLAKLIAGIEKPTSGQILLDDTVGNVFSCMQNDHMIVMAWHMNSSESYRTMFIIDLSNGDVIRRDLMFSQDGIPVVQDDQYLLLAEVQQRSNVLITRIDMISGTAAEFIFSGTYRSMSADSEYIYLLDQENTVHILDGANPENEINWFEIETSENESCRVIFAR